MKKFLTTVLSCALLLGTTAALPAAADTTAIGWTPHEATDLRVGILNDTHMRNAEATHETVNHILQSQKEIANGQMNGMALVGDVVFYNSADDCADRRHYANMYASIGESFPDAPILYAMGNHEFPFGVYDDETSAKAHAAFKAGTGQELNAHKVFKGNDEKDYHFIAISPDNAHSVLSAETQTWAMQEIENAIGADSTNANKDDASGNYSFAEGTVPDSTKPVFLLCHAPLPGTALGCTEGGDVKAFVSYLKTRPQVIVLSGHMHAAAKSPDTIWQDGFTLFSGSINWGAPFQDYLLNEKPSDSAASLHQGAMLEVKDNVVKIFKLDYDTNEEIGTPWVVDIPTIVNNLRDGNTDNDKDAFYYCSETRSKVTTTAAFPEDAELTAVAKKNGVTLTYPNNAVVTNSDPVQQDDYVRGYRVEIVNDKGVAILRESHIADYYVAEANRTPSYTRTVNGLKSGTSYTAKVYPILPLGTYGTPLEASFTTKGDVKVSNSVRYEIEDYCTGEKFEKLIANYDSASNGKLVLSSQGGVIEKPGLLGRHEVEGSDANNEKPFIITFDIDLPVEDEYSVSYAANYLNSNYISKVTFSVDDQVIGDNSKKGVVDLSLDNTYPWSEMPMQMYSANTSKLTAGKHTVTVQMDVPTSKTNGAGTAAQPFLFAADYIEFTPKTPNISAYDVERIELENYASTVSIEQNNGTTGTASSFVSPECSEGYHLHIDTDDNTAKNDFESIVVPINVVHGGDYLMEYVDCKGVSAANFYIDSTEGEALNASGFTATELDPANDEHTYFGHVWAAPVRHNGKVTLPQGQHNLIITVSKRGGFGDFAVCLDYVQFTPSTQIIAADDETTIEFEEYQSEFTPKQPSVESNDAANGLTYVNSPNAGKETITLNVPIVVEKAGGYQIDARVSAAGHLSLISLMEGDETLYTFDANRAVSDAGQWDTHYTMKNFSFGLNLTEGAHTLTFSVAPRESYSATVAFAMDYMRFKPTDLLKVNENDDTATVSAVYDDSVSGTAVLALYHNHALIGVATQSVSDTFRVDIIAQTHGEAVTSAKLMIWENLQTLKPVAETKTEFFMDSNS